MSSAPDSHHPLPPPTAALEALFHQHHGPVFAAAFRITGSAQDAEDVLQTVFLRLLRRGEALDLAPSPGSYLYRAAVNAALDLVRSRARKRSLPLDEIDLPSDAPGPDRFGRAREIRRCLRLALTGLTPKSAEIFTLRFLEGFDNHEIARMTRSSQTAIGVMVHRARSRVKKAMGDCVGGLSHV